MTVTIIESVNLESERTDAGCWILGKIEPVAVLVQGGEVSCALDMKANAVNECLLQEYRALPAQAAIVSHD